MKLKSLLVIMANRISKLSLSKKVKPVTLLSRFSSRVDSSPEEKIELTRFATLPNLASCEFAEGTRLLSQTVAPTGAAVASCNPSTSSEEGMYEVMSTDLPVYEN